MSSSADRTGKPRAIAEAFDVSEAAACLRYYGGWADKNSGRIQEVHDQKLALIRHEPIGVVGQIIPWNFPSALAMSLIALTVASPHVRLVRQRHCDLTDATQEDRPGARDRQRHRHEGASCSVDALTPQTSENTPLSALKVCELAAKILPKGVLNVLTGYGKTAVRRRPTAQI